MDVATDGVKLLLVEDSPADVFLVREAMKVEGLPFRLQVADNGVGIDESRVVAPSSYGIMGIRERAQSLGGQVSIHGVRGRGTTLELEIPLPAEEEG